MNRHWRSALWALLLALPALQAVADYPLEIIRLEGRPVEQVLPIIRPFLIEGGSAGGMNNQLILRTSKENLEEIRRILQRIDRPPRRLVISVRQGALGMERDSGVAADVRVRAGESIDIGTGRPMADAGIRLHGLSSSTRSDLTVSQRVQTLEGRPAFISTGRSVPVTRERFIAGAPLPAYGSRTRYRNITQGFYALPRLNGDRVTIELSPQMERFGTRGGEFDIQRVRTVVSGRLGEWIAVGQSSRHGGSGASTTLRRLSTRDHQDSTLYLKVDELP